MFAALNKACERGNERVLEEKHGQKQATRTKVITLPRAFKFNRDGHRKLTHIIQLPPHLHMPLISHYLDLT